MKQTLRLAVAALLVCGGCTGVRETIDDWRVEARLGVIATPEIEWPKSTGSLRRALAWRTAKPARVTAFGAAYLAIGALFLVLGAFSAAGTIR